MHYRCLTARQHELLSRNRCSLDDHDREGDGDARHRPGLAHGYVQRLDPRRDRHDDPDRARSCIDQVQRIDDRANRRRQLRHRRIAHECELRCPGCDRYARNRQGDSDDHVGQSRGHPVRHRTRSNAAQRGCHGRRWSSTPGHVRVQPGVGHGAPRGTTADALRGVHADRHEELQRSSTRLPRP